MGSLNSRPKMLVVRLCATLSVGLGLGACDPMGASDGISPAGGLAQRHNARIMVINPYAGDGPGPNPGGSGLRMERVMERYRSGADPSVEAEGGETDGVPES